MCMCRLIQMLVGKCCAQELVWRQGNANDPIRPDSIDISMNYAPQLTAIVCGMQVHSAEPEHL